MFGIRLALEEAVVNAIKHGNRLDQTKQVHVVCKSTPDKIWIKISDEGPGFNPELRARLHRPAAYRCPQRPRHHADAQLHEPGRIQRPGQRRGDGKAAQFGQLACRAKLPLMRPEAFDATSHRLFFDLSIRRGGICPIHEAPSCRGAVC